MGAGAGASANAPPADSAKPHARLIFSRHGESEWNVANRFTGWVDVDLSEKGTAEAKNAGALLKEEGFHLDIAYTSYLKRAIKTCNYCLEFSDQMHVPVEKTWRLNERMYGGLQGLDKKETVVKHGADQVLIWRRSFDLPPPEIERDHEFFTGLERKYKDLKPEEIPVTESLKDVIARVEPYCKEFIEPHLKAGKTVLVAAHGNSIRAIVKYIEGIADDVIPTLEIPTGTPLVYEFDADLHPIASSQAVEPLHFGHYLGDAEKIKAAAEAVKNQTKVVALRSPGYSLARALARSIARSLERSLARVLEHPLAHTTARYSPAPPSPEEQNKMVCEMLELNYNDVKAKAKEMFDKHDTDGSGTIKLSELIPVMMRMTEDIFLAMGFEKGSMIYEAAIEEAKKTVADDTKAQFKQLDRDGSADLSKEEFFAVALGICMTAAMFPKQNKTGSMTTIDEALTKMFQSYDIDQSGWVSMEENLAMDKAFSEKMGAPFDEQESKNSFTDSDANKDGKVTLAEFVPYAKSKLPEGVTEQEALDTIMMVNMLLKENKI